MDELSAPLRDQVLALALSERHPAYLVVAADGRVVARGGALERYALDGLDVGDDARAATVFEGLLPFERARLVLPAVEVRRGQFADVVAEPAAKGDGTLVLILDANAEVERVRSTQQERHELELRLERAPSDAGEVLSALGAVVLERVTERSFRLMSEPPEWMGGAYRRRGDVIEPGAEHPFLENFLVDADAFWARAEPGVLRSGTWREGGLVLEALAIQLAKGRRVLVIEHQGETYRELQSLLQKARERSLSFDSLQREVQKKEVLLHCIVHDLKGPLTGLVGNLSLMKSKALAPERVHMLATRGLDQARRQTGMIETVLEVFSSELSELEAFETRVGRAPDLVDCARVAAESFDPAFQAQGVALKLELPDEELFVCGRGRRLVRVFANLLDNALRHSPEGTVVSLVIEREGELARVRIEDQGPGVPTELEDVLFQKFARARTSGGMAGLGLYFCRFSVEQWGGQIGYTARPEGGSRFWFALPLAKG